MKFSRPGLNGNKSRGLLWLFLLNSKCPLNDLSCSFLSHFTKTFSSLWFSYLLRHIICRNAGMFLFLIVELSIYIWFLPIFFIAILILLVMPCFSFLVGVFVSHENFYRRNQFLFLSSPKQIHQLRVWLWLELFIEKKKQKFQRHSIVWVVQEEIIGRYFSQNC